MQTVNNNFTVEALVAKYRNFVDEHCPKSCESDGVHEFAMPYNDEAEEQLLATLYKRVAGENADSNILEALFKYTEEFYAKGLNETHRQMQSTGVSPFPVLRSVSLKVLRYQPMPAG